MLRLDDLLRLDDFILFGKFKKRTAHRGKEDTGGKKKKTFTQIGRDRQKKRRSVRESK